MDMNYYTIDSEIIEILDTLRPPVKREGRNTYLGYVIGAPDNVEVVRDFSHAYRTELHKTSKQRRTVKSSLSLILQKTCKRQILEKYSFNSNDSRLQEIHADKEDTSVNEKPLIRVTVIPKTDHQAAANFLEEHNEVTRKDKNTQLIHKNSFNTKNVYLIVAGSKNEKVYEIKTTGSAKTLKYNFKHVKDLLTKRNKKSDMERNKKKSLVKEKKPELSNVGCQCQCTSENLRDTHGGSSRVKIVGRVGLNEDDKYVVRCAATINGQPVSTEYTDGGKKIFYPYYLADEKSIETTKESQGTQVDIDTELSPPHQTNDQKVQCYSYDVDNNDGEESNMNSLKSSNSPLVIITVYPKQDVNSYPANTKRESVFPTQSANQNNRLFQDNKNKPIILNANYAINTDFQRTREPSPEVTKTQNFDISESHKNENIEINKITKTGNKSRSASPTNKFPKYTIQERKQQMNTNVPKTNTRNQSPKIHKMENKQQKPVTVAKQNSKNVTYSYTRTKDNKQHNTNNMKYQSRFQDKSVNTDKPLRNYTEAEVYSEKARKNKNKKRNIGTKKDVHIPNNQRKGNQDPVVYKKYFPINNISKVSVNIDSEKECYDVILEKGKFSTDVTVRTTTKEKSSQKYFEKNFEATNEPNFRHSHVSADSLENFFPMEMADRHRRSASQAFNSGIGAFPISEHTSRLNVRDSLEISHRRDGKDLKTQPAKRLFQYDSVDDLDDIISPKHFIGDECVISDPVERDKEIRQLLGIDKRRIAPEYNDKTQYKSGHLFSSHCLFHSALREPLVRALMLRKSCSCPSCTKKLAKLNEPNYVNRPKPPKIRCLIGDVEKEQILVYSVPKIKKQVNVIGRNNVNRIPITMSQLPKCEALVESLIRDDSTQKFINLQSYSKRKPIQLSIEQYKKVKQSLKVSGKLQKSKQNWNTSIVSIGNIKTKTKSEYLMHWHKEVQTDSRPVDLDLFNCNIKKPKLKETNEDTKKETVTLFCRDINVDKSHNKRRNDEVRKIASSVEIRYNSITYLNDVKFSCTNFESLGSSNLQRKKHQSIETIYRGHKKSRTPNLGASALSLLSEDGRSVSKSESSESKPRKPFLRRLMSCLVMRSGRASAARLALEKRPPTMYSSIDSYHVSTSLGAIEMSSSLYDTSASFYSKHTIGPINNKMKRGFFSSVRGFLTTRKS